MCLVECLPRGERMLPLKADRQRNQTAQIGHRRPSQESLIKLYFMRDGNGDNARRLKPDRGRWEHSAG